MVSGKIDRSQMVAGGRIPVRMSRICHRLRPEICCKRRPSVWGMVARGGGQHRLFVALVELA
jgi:hypothetical protein